MPLPEPTPVFIVKALAPHQINTPQKAQKGERELLKKLPCESPRQLINEDKIPQKKTEGRTRVIIKYSSPVNLPDM